MIVRDSVAFRKEGEPRVLTFYDLEGTKINQLDLGDQPAPLLGGNDRYLFVPIIDRDNQNNQKIQVVDFKKIQDKNLKLEDFFSFVQTYDSNEIQG